MWAHQNNELLQQWKHRHQVEAKKARRNYLAQLEALQKRIGPGSLLALLKRHGLLHRMLPLPEEVEEQLRRFSSRS
jgi:hypothetical protein